MATFMNMMGFVKHGYNNITFNSVNRASYMGLSVSLFILIFINYDALFLYISSLFYYDSVHNYVISLNLSFDHL